MISHHKILVMSHYTTILLVKSLFCCLISPVVVYIHLVIHKSNQLCPSIKYYSNYLLIEVIDILISSTMMFIDFPII